MRQAQATTPDEPPSPPSYESLLPYFIKCNRYFNGAFGKPDEAEDWLAQVERSFDVFELPHHLRVNYGTYMLRLNARMWWDSKKRELVPPVTWEMFRHEFLENYFPGSLRVQYSADFLNISQGDHSIEEYETKFNRLLQYAPESYKNSEELKRQVFLNGLNEDLRTRLEEFDIKSYQGLLERARIVENAQKKRRKGNDKELKRKLYLIVTPSPKVGIPQLNEGPNEKENQAIEVVQCWKCAKRHYPKQCPQLQSRCYLCGNPNHKFGSCPKKTPTTCSICTKMGHLANTCPGRDDPHITSLNSSRKKRKRYTKNGSNQREGNQNFSGTSSFRNFIYDPQQRLEYEEVNDEELEPATIEGRNDLGYNSMSG